MTQLGFFIDLTKCTGCQTCTVACKDAHNLEVGRNFRKVLEAESGSWKQDKATGAWHQDVCAYYGSISCNHCVDPACVKVCPTKAHFKRKEDGLVVIDTKKCIGCGACAMACPYHAPVLNPVTKKMSKCDGCLNRLQAGLHPSAWNPVRSEPSSSAQLKNFAASTASSLRSLRCPILHRRNPRS